MKEKTNTFTYMEVIKIIEKYMENYKEIHGEKVKIGIEMARKRQLKRLEKLKNKTTSRLDVLAKLNEKERRVIFDNMGLDFEEENKKVIDYIKGLEKAVNILFE